MMLPSVGIISLLIGAVFGLRFKITILFPAIGLVFLGTAVFGIRGGHPIGSLLPIMALEGCALQIGYLAGIVARAVISSTNADAPQTFGYRGAQHSLDISKSLAVQDRMEVVGSDGRHVGTVDRRESFDRIILAKDDLNAGGRPHLISMKWVDYVDGKVHLNIPSKKAMAEWQVAA